MIFSFLFKKFNIIINVLRIPVCTIFHPHESEGMTAARISPDAKQIVTVSDGKCQNVYFWLWTYGNDTPDGLLFAFC